MHWFDGNQTPNNVEKLEIDWDEGNNSDEDDADVDDSDFEDEESNDEFDDASIAVVEIVALTVWYLLYFLTFSWYVKACGIGFLHFIGKEWLSNKIITTKPFLSASRILRCWD